MRRWELAVLATWALGRGALVCAQPAAVLEPGPCEPPSGCYIGAYIELDPVVRNDVARFEQITGKKHATYFRYVGYGQPFPFEWANQLKGLDAMPHIAWEPNEGLGPVKDDEYLRGWAEACAHYGAPIFLRFASEMNGDWQAYSGDPDEYVRKWRMVWGVFHEVAPNVIFCWCPFASPKSTIPLYYPGNEYVDWVGVNAYSVMYNNGQVTRRSVEDTVANLEFIYNLYADSKPIAIGEYAATHFCQASGKSVPDYAVREMRRLYSAIETRFPRVKMVNWFSVDTVNEGLAHNDYSLTGCPELLGAYRTTVASPHFISRVMRTGRLATEMIASEPGDATGPVESTPAPVATVTRAPLAFAEEASPRPGAVAVVIRGGLPNALKGRVTVEAILGAGLSADRVVLELDGRMRALSTAPPYSFPWNTERSTPGEHVIRVSVRDAGGNTLVETEAAAVVAGGAT